MIIVPPGITRDPIVILVRRPSLTLPVIHCQNDHRTRAGQHLLRIAAFFGATLDPAHLTRRSRFQPAAKLRGMARRIAPRDPAISKTDLSRTLDQIGFYFSE